MTINFEKPAGDFDVFFEHHGLDLVMSSIVCSEFTCTIGAMRNDLEEPLHDSSFPLTMIVCDKDTGEK